MTPWITERIGPRLSVDHMGKGEQLIWLCHVDG